MFYYRVSNSHTKVLYVCAKMRRTWKATCIFFVMPLLTTIYALEWAPSNANKRTYYIDRHVIIYELTTNFYDTHSPLIIVNQPLMRQYTRFH